jgi:hypothetical protein
MKNRAKQKRGEPSQGQAPSEAPKGPSVWRSRWLKGIGAVGLTVLGSFFHHELSVLWEAVIPYGADRKIISSVQVFDLRNAVHDNNDTSVAVGSYAFVTKSYTVERLRNSFGTFQVRFGTEGKGVHISSSSHVIKDIDSHEEGYMDQHLRISDVVVDVSREEKHQPFTVVVQCKYENGFNQPDSEWVQIRPPFEGRSTVVILFPMSKKPTDFEVAQSPIQRTPSGSDWRKETGVFSSGDSLIYYWRVDHPDTTVQHTLRWKW